MNITFKADGAHAVELSKETVKTAKVRAIIPDNNIGGRAHETDAEMRVGGVIRSSSETAIKDNSVEMAKWAADINDANAYQSVTVKTDGAGVVVNETVYPYAFMVAYEEVYDVASGVGTFEAVLHQKRDKLAEIQVSGGYANE